MWKTIKDRLRTGIQKLFSYDNATQNLAEHSPKGMLIFAHTGDVIRAETLLRDTFKTEVKGPPPNVHTGCDMIIVFELLFEMPIMRMLKKAAIEPLKVIPLIPDQDILLEPVSLYHVRDFGAWLMVRAANMKITIEKSSGCIVNISGGGCPDVPYLAHHLTGKTLAEVTTNKLEPRHKGHTLCSYSLQKAFEEAKRQCQQSKEGASCGL